eukprot:6995074-Alexandrium_andersonii.AAC.1
MGAPRPPFFGGLPHAGPWAAGGMRPPMMMGPPGPWGCPWPTPPPGWNEYFQAWPQQQQLAAREGAAQAPVGASPRRVCAGSPDDVSAGRGRSPARPDGSPAGRCSPAP